MLKKFVIYLTLKEDGDVLFSELFNSFGEAKTGIDEFLSDFGTKRGKKILYVNKDEIKKFKLSPKKCEDNVFYVRKNLTEAVLYQKITDLGYFSNSCRLSKIGKTGLNEFCIKVTGTKSNKPQKNEELQEDTQKNSKESEENSEKEQKKEKNINNEQKNVENEQKIEEKPQKNVEKEKQEESGRKSPFEEKIKSSHVTNYERGAHVSLIGEMKKRLEEIRKRKEEMSKEEGTKINEQNIEKKIKESREHVKENFSGVKFVKSLETGKQRLRHVDIPNTGRSFNLVSKNVKNINPTVIIEEIIAGM